MSHRRGDRRRRGALSCVSAAAAEATKRRDRVTEPAVRARRGDGAGARRAGSTRSVRDAACRPASDGGRSSRRPQLENGSRRGGRGGSSLAADRALAPRASTWIITGDAWMQKISSRSSPVPMFLNLCGVSGPTTITSPGPTSTSLPSAVIRAAPLRTIHVSEYGCLWRSGPSPGRLLTRKNEMSEPWGSPSNLTVPRLLGGSSLARISACTTPLLSLRGYCA